MYNIGIRYGEQVIWQKKRNNIQAEVLLNITDGEPFFKYWFVKSAI